MRLLDLNPRWGKDLAAASRTHLIMTCPKCGKHRIAVRIAGQGKFTWALTGADFATFTLEPSVQEDATEGPLLCGFHYVVHGGEVTVC